MNADKDDEDEEEDESNVSRFEGSNIMGSSPTFSSGSDTSTVSRIYFSETLSVLTFPSVVFLWENHLSVISHPSSRRETLISWWKRRLPLLERLHGPQDEPNFARPQRGGLARRHAGRLQHATISDCLVIHLYFLFVL